MSLQPSIRPSVSLQLLLFASGLGTFNVGVEKATRSESQNLGDAHTPGQSAVLPKYRRNDGALPAPVQGMQ